MNAIVVVDKNWGIGKNNDLLFKLTKDMAFFKEKTMGKVVVNGMCGAYWNNYQDPEILGSLIVGTLGVSNNMCGLITSPTNSFEEGESTIVSQNLGNKNITRALKAFIYTLISVTIVSMTGYILMRFVFINQFVEDCEL